MNEGYAMMAQQLTMPISSVGPPAVIHAAQGEDGARVFDITLIGPDGGAVDVAGAHAELCVDRGRDGVLAVGATTTGGVIRVALPYGATAYPGDCHCWLHVVTDSYDLRVGNLVLRAQACPIDGAIADSGQAGILVELIQQTEQATGAANTAAAKANKFATDADTAATAANDAASAASRSAYGADAAAEGANNAAGRAYDVANVADRAAMTADEAARNANNAATDVSAATKAANTAAVAANTAAEDARNMAEQTARETAKHEIADKLGAPGGIATLDANMRTTQLPSGTIPVSGGGTGKTSWVANRLPYPSGSTTFAQLAPPAANGAVLRQNTTGAPYWGTPAEVTAAGIDSGSNANGDWIKFGDGTMIVTQRYVYTGDIDYYYAEGAIYHTRRMDIPAFPVAFLKPPITSVTAVGPCTVGLQETAIATATGISSLQFTWPAQKLGVLRLEAHIIAIGRWK